MWKETKRETVKEVGIWSDVPNVMLYKIIYDEEIKMEAGDTISHKLPNDEDVEVTIHKKDGSTRTIKARVVWSDT